MTRQQSADHDWWAEILAHGVPFPEIARLLARHPDHEVMTAHLLDGLTVERLVEIAEVEHNRCRLDLIPDHLCEETRAQMAWDLLHTGIRNREQQSPGSAWVETAELLSGAADSERQLDQLRHAPIHRLITVCERLIAGPYRHVLAARGR